MHPDTTQDFHPVSVSQSWLQAIVPSLLLCIFVAFLWPFLKYYVDPDAIAYLNITAKYVSGDYAHAVNAFWSPLGCWLTALLVKSTHGPLFQSAIIVNTIPAMGMVFTGQKLFQQFRSNGFERWCLGLMSAVFFSYTVYFQAFTDLWQFFFLTLGLLILLKKNFTSNALWWPLLGIIAALSFFAKAYSFVFYPIMIIVVTAIKLHAEGNLKFKKLALISCISIGVMILSISPWVYLLHQKYGIWTYSTAGKLNMSWWLVGTQEFRPDIHALAPPPYNGSLFYFEDPYLAQGPFAHFWDSPHLFIKQMARVGYNIIRWVESCNRISTFYFIIWILSILFVARKKQTIFKPTNLKILVIIFLIFPLPYWLMTFDRGRYLWGTIPIVSVLALYMMELFAKPKMNSFWYKCFLVAFFAAFLVTPVSDLKDMYKNGFAEHEIAEQLNALNIKGSFISNKSLTDEPTKLIQISWFTQNPWYCHNLSNYTTKTLLEDAERYHVKYYFYFYNGTGEDFQLRDLKGVLLEDLTHNTINGLKVFKIDAE
jgi:hypothetical protein